MSSKVYSERYFCEPCGYVYDPVDGDPDGGVAAGVAFADVPAEWFCAVCGAEKESFVALSA
jgi:rubredoxin